MAGKNGVIGVLVVDDNEILGDAFQRWLERTEGMRCLGWTGDLSKVDELVATLSPDVVLLDVDMPGGDTFAVLRRVAKAHPEVRIVMFSGHMRSDYMDRALDDGAAGYLVKDESPTAIVDYIRRAAAREVVVSATARDWGQRVVGGGLRG